MQAWGWGRHIETRKLLSWPEALLAWTSAGRGVIRGVIRVIWGRMKQEACLPDWMGFEDGPSLGSEQRGGSQDEGDLRSLGG